jgi:hypothetical protein
MTRKAVLKYIKFKTTNSTTDYDSKAVPFSKQTAKFGRATTEYNRKQKLNHKKRL